MSGSTLKINQRDIRIVLLGFGSVSKSLCKILLEKPDQVRTALGRDIHVVGVCDSKVAMYNSKGFDIAALLRQKETGNRRFDTSSAEVVCKRDDDSPHSLALLKSGIEYDVFIDGSPNEQPALSCIRHALETGRRVVTANKTPIAQHFSELHKYPHASQRLRFSATVCGGLPVLNVGTLDLPVASIKRLRGIFNSTSNYVLDQLREGKSREMAIEHAQKVGIAEADYMRDLNGYDTANKLCIVANAVLKMPCTHADIPTRGVEKITAEEISEAAKRGKVVRLVALATRREDGSYDLSVQPEEVPIDSFLGRCGDTSMCIEFETDIFENISLMTDEKGVFPTAAAILRDIIDVSAGI